MIKWQISHGFFTQYMSKNVAGSHHTLFECVAESTDQLTGAPVGSPDTGLATCNRAQLGSDPTVVPSAIMYGMAGWEVVGIMDQIPYTCD